MKFTLEIELGNAAMSTCDDLARALCQISEHVFAGLDQEPIEDSERIADDNGNTVGRWKITE